MDVRKRPPQLVFNKASDGSGRTKTTIVIPAVCFLALCVVATVTLGVYSRSSLEFLRFNSDSYTRTSPSTNSDHNKLLDGLLSSAFPQNTCQSRYQSHIYRKNSPYKPSPHLQQTLRNYEARHERCAPHGHLYNQTLLQLASNTTTGGTTECNYVIFMPENGLGNRILGLTATFLYALLTNRTLLLQNRREHMSHLFCEAFPNGSWLLPLDFPLEDFRTLSRTSSLCYGNMVKNNNISANKLPSYLYVHLMHDYKGDDKRFYCESDQELMQKVSWMVLRSNNYFVPGLFLIPSFERELSKLFPEKDTVFHHLGRYLLHPTDPVWGMITRFYDSYLANESEKIGIQIRSFSKKQDTFRHVLDQVLTCTWREKLLPQVDLKTHVTAANANINIYIKPPKVVLLTSLQTIYFDHMTNMYWEHPTTTSHQVVWIYQASHESFQQTNKVSHDMKAWAEMYLLSLCDKLVTSSWSTFGYVAQGLAGVRPWVLFKDEYRGAEGLGGLVGWIRFRNETVGDRICRRVVSMEPCFHVPPMYDCNAKREGVSVKLNVSYIRHCEDMSWGLKLVGGQY